MAHFPVEPTAEAYRMTEFEQAAADEGWPPAKSHETRRKLVEIFGKHARIQGPVLREKIVKSRNSVQIFALVHQKRRLQLARTPATPDGRFQKPVMAAFCF